MQITGTVTKLKGNIAVVKTTRPKSCENCVNSDFCNKKELEIYALNEKKAEKGDIVTVETSDRQSLLLMSYIFLTPILIIFLGYFLFKINAYLSFVCIPITVVFVISLKILDKRFKSKSFIINIYKESYEGNTTGDSVNCEFLSKDNQEDILE